MTRATTAPPAPPHDLDAEQSVLGSILLNPQAIAKIVNSLQPEDFYRENNGQIYRASLDMFAAGEPIDNVTLAAHLQTMGLLDRVGGRAHLASMQGAVPTAANVEHYGRIVARLAVKRRKAEQAREVARVYDNPLLDATVAEPLVQQLAAPAPNGSRPHSPTQNLAAVFRASDLMKLNLPEILWAIPGLLPEGLGILASRPKRGKSWMVLGWCVAVATGGFVLGKVPVQKGDALYIALEDSHRRLQSRLQTMLGSDGAPDGLYLTTSWPRLDEGGHERLRDWLERHPDARLVVIDTWAKIRPRTKRDEDRYAKDYADAGLLKGLADEFSVAICVLHHTRKMGADDWLDGISGTLGLAGAADAILGLFGNRGEREAPLKITGRDVPETELMLAFDGAIGIWTLIGEGELARLSGERKAILDLLHSAGPLAPAQIATRLDRNPSTVRSLMQRLRASGFVAKDGERYSAVVGKSSSPALDLLADIEAFQ
jgi:hypothetical protein